MDCDYYAEWKTTDNALDVTVLAKVKDDEWVGIGFSNNQVMVRHFVNNFVNVWLLSLICSLKRTLSLVILIRMAMPLWRTFTLMGKKSIVNLTYYHSTCPFLLQLCSSEGRYYSRCGCYDVGKKGWSYQDEIPKSYWNFRHWCTVKLIFWHIRKSITWSLQMDIQLKDAVHMVFPYSGGKVFAGRIIGKHSKTPIISQEKMSFAEAGKQLKITLYLLNHWSEFSFG